LAKQEIPRVSRPDKDPVAGKQGPLLNHWV
jgi:uncharacterized protein YjlB